MDKVELNELKKVKLNKPILIEGLPGLGYVGKITAEHLVKELKAEKFAELYSPDLPPQVMIQQDGTVRMTKNEFFYYKARNSKQHDLIILTGDAQGMTIQSHYTICGKIIDLAKEHKASLVCTLGGFGTGRIVKDPQVFGAASNAKLIPEFKKLGVVFGKVTGPIVGAAGLLLGIGELRGMHGVCLMGETHGNYADPTSAKRVLGVLCKYLNLKVPVQDLDKQAKEAAAIIAQFEQMQAQQGGAGGVPVKPVTPEEPLSYIR